MLIEELMNSGGISATNRYQNKIVQFMVNN